MIKVEVDTEQLVKLSRDEVNAGDMSRYLHILKSNNRTRKVNELQVAEYGQELIDKVEGETKSVL